MLGGDLIFIYLREPSFQDIISKKGTEISDVSKVVDCRPTAIKRDFAWLDYGLQGVRERVKS